MNKCLLQIDVSNSKEKVDSIEIKLGSDEHIQVNYSKLVILSDISEIIANILKH